MTIAKLSVKHDFGFKFKDRRVISIFLFELTSNETTRVKEFTLCCMSRQNYMGILNHMLSLTDQQCADFMKTSKVMPTPRPSGEYHLILEDESYSDFIVTMLQ